MARKTNFTANGKEYYRVTKTIGHKADGTTIRKTFYGSCKADAEEKANKYINSLNAGLDADFKDKSIAEATATWLHEVKHNDANFSENSFTRYEGIYRNYIEKSELAHLKVFYTKSIQIQQHYNSLANSGKTYNQIKNLNKVLSGMFEWAIQEGYALKNPCSTKVISIPKTQTDAFDETETDNEDDFFTREELEKIIKAVNKKIASKDEKFDCFPYLVLFSIGTGARQGEALGLQAEYLTELLVKIRKELARVKEFKNRKFVGYRYKLTKPKTPSSIRDIALSQHLRQVMVEYIKLLKQFYKDNNISFTNKSFIFVSSSCTYIDASNLRKRWKEPLIEIGVPHKKWHALRHGFACLMFWAGADIKSVQEMLGHADVHTTLKIYLHVNPENKQAAINKADAFLSKF